MNPCRLFVLRPVMTLLLAGGVLVFGVVAWVLLPVAALPQIEYPTIKVTSLFPGASAETMATAVAAPLERQFVRLNGITSLTSSSSLGRTTLRLRFGLDRDIDRAAMDVQSAISNAAGDLPPDLPNPPILAKENPAEPAMVVMALTSDTLPLTEVDRFADDAIVRRISSLPGISRAFIANEQKFAIRVQVNPVALSSRGLSLEDVRAAIQHATANRPKGRLEGGDVVATVDMNDQVFDAAELRGVLISRRNDVPVHLSDVALVENSVENNKSAGWYNGQPAIIIGVLKRPGANTVKTVDGLRSALEALRATLPASIDLNVVTDRAETIRASLRDTEWTLAVTIALVITVIFLFLRHFLATLVPSITIPLSLLATLTVLVVFGFTLDNLSLMALTIGVGFLVDDAIVVVENVVRHLECGEPPIDAAINGAGEVAFTILSITVSLVAVFIPVFFMDGIVGRVFREFGITVSTAIVASGIISLTLSPMLCAQLLRPAGKAVSVGSGLTERWLRSSQERAAEVYRESVLWVLRHRQMTLAGFVLTTVLAILLYGTIAKGFFPPQDNGRIFGAAEAAAGTPFATTSHLIESVTEAIRSDKDVFSVTSYAGGDGDENTGALIINLKPRGERPEVHRVLDNLRTRTASIAGLRFVMKPEPEIVTGTEVGGAEYQYTLFDPDRAELEQWTPIILDRLKHIPGLIDVSRSAYTAPSVKVLMNRDLAARLAINTATLDDILYDALGARRVAKIYTDADQYYVLMEVPPYFQSKMSALQLIDVPSADGTQVPLSSFARFTNSVSKTTINHYGQFPSETVGFNLEPGLSVGQAMERIRNAEAELDKPMTLNSTFTGIAQEFEQSLKSQPWLIAAAVLVVYIVLGILYESVIHPLTILSSLPSAGVGAMLALKLCGYSFDVMGMIGIILLIGIVKKNAIMMVDFANRAEAQGMEPGEAIVKACLVRFRPIMMTTIAAILGSLPLVLGTGAGSELRRPLGIAIIGGLIVSQTLTLYTVPVIHLTLRILSSRIVLRWQQIRQNVS